MGWPQFAYLALIFISVGMNCARHGQPRDGKHNGWTSLVAAGIILSILWAGGFFG